MVVNAFRNFYRFQKHLKGEIDGIHIGKQHALNTRVWLWRYGDTIIDCGPPNQWKIIKQCFESNSTDKLRHILVSHHHEDHCANAGKMKELFNEAQIYCPPNSIDLLRKGYYMEWYRKLIYGEFHGDHQYDAKPFPQGLYIKDKSQHCVDIVPIAAPGHSPDHNIFYLPSKGWLFSADLLVTSSPKVVRFDEDVLKGYYSLENVLKKCDFQEVFCSHLGLVENGRTALENRYKWLHELRGKSIDLHNKGLPIKEITNQLLGKEEFIYYITQGDFSKRFLIEGLLSDIVPPPEYRVKQYQYPIMHSN